MKLRFWHLRNTSAISIFWVWNETVTIITLTLHAVWLSLYLKQGGMCPLESRTLHMVWSWKLHLKYPLKKMLIYDVILTCGPYVFYRFEKVFPNPSKNWKIMSPMNFFCQEDLLTNVSRWYHHFIRKYRMVFYKACVCYFSLF